MYCHLINLAQKIDLKLIIKSETPPIIDSEFLDRFRALLRISNVNQFYDFVLGAKAQHTI